MLRPTTVRVAAWAAILAASAVAASPTMAAYRHWGGLGYDRVAPFGYGYAPFRPCVTDEGDGRYAPCDIGAG
jgi:hypothetical protein